MAKLNKSLTVYLLVVSGAKISTKYFLSLYVGVYKADKIGLKGGQPSTYFLWRLQYPYIISDLVPTGFRCLRVFGHAVRVNKLFINFINVLFLTGNKMQEIIIFFWNFLSSLQKFFIYLIYVSLTNIDIELPLSEFWMKICLFWVTESNSPFDKCWGTLLL